MNTKINIYFHLIFSLALIPVILFGPTFTKLLIMLYAAWLIMKKDAGSLPALAIISSYMSNTFIIYFAVIVLSGINFKKLKSFGVHLVFILLLIFLPYILYLTGLKIFVFGLKAGLVLNQFQLYFSMFAFFYGILIMESFNRKVMQVTMLTLVLLYLLSYVNLINPLFINVRLNFYTIPFFGAFFAYFLSSNVKDKQVAYFLIGTGIILSSVILTSSTFTIYLTTFFAFVLASLYFRRRHYTLRRATGTSAFIIVILLLFYAITGFEKNDYSDYLGESMEEVNSIESLTNRIGMKFFDDRAPIWVGVWEDIIYEKNWLPPLEVENIRASARSTIKKIDFEFHSHNLYLELLRTNGIVMGFVLSFIFIYFSLLGRKILSIPNADPLFIVFVTASISTLIIGSFTGIYVLLSTYAIFALTIVGVAYAVYNKSILKKQQTP